MEAVILILKHATFLRLTNLSRESALTHAEMDYQEGNIGLKIQQCLVHSSQEHPVEDFVGFIMSTNIGLFILPSVRIISHQGCMESTHLDSSVLSQSSANTQEHRKHHWFKQFWDPLRKTTVPK